MMVKRTKVVKVWKPRTIMTVYKEINGSWRSVIVILLIPYPNLKNIFYNFTQVFLRGRHLAKIFTHILANKNNLNENISQFNL